MQRQIQICGHNRYRWKRRYMAFQDGCWFSMCFFFLRYNSWDKSNEHLIANSSWLMTCLSGRERFESDWESKSLPVRHLSLLWLRYLDAGELGLGLRFLVIIFDFLAAMKLPKTHINNFRFRFFNGLRFCPSSIESIGEARVQSSLICANGGVVF